MCVVPFERFVSDSSWCLVWLYCSCWFGCWWCCLCPCRCCCVGCPLSPVACVEWGCLWCLCPGSEGPVDWLFCWCAACWYQCCRRNFSHHPCSSVKRFSIHSICCLCFCRSSLPVLVARWLRWQQKHIACPVPCSHWDWIRRCSRWRLLRCGRRCWWWPVFPDSRRSPAALPWWTRWCNWP